MLVYRIVSFCEELNQLHTEYSRELLFPDLLNPTLKDGAPARVSLVMGSPSFMVVETEPVAGDWEREIRNYLVDMVMPALQIYRSYSCSDMPY